MSVKKSSKGELVAIYRLEFYKNQKQWKFSKNDKNKRPASPKQNLNATYRVSGAPAVEPPAALDDAFLHDDDDVKEVFSPPRPARGRWVTLLDLKPCECEEPGDPCAEPLSSYEGLQEYPPELDTDTPHRLPVFAGWHANELADTNTERNMLRDMLRTDTATRNEHIECLNLDRKIPNMACLNQSVDRNLYDSQPRLKPSLSQNFLYDLNQMEVDTDQYKAFDKNFVLQNFGKNDIECDVNFGVSDKIGCAPGEGELEMVEWGVGGAAAALAQAEGWLKGPAAQLYLERASESQSESSGDSASFMRGAHARAHSSELDLTDSCVCGLPARSLARVSSSQLARCLARHASVAGHMLAELRRRTGTREDRPPLISPDASLWPTRDLPVPCDVTPATRDVTHASRDVTCAGRGRGRLMSTK